MTDLNNLHNFPLEANTATFLSQNEQGSIVSSISLFTKTLFYLTILNTSTVYMTGHEQQTGKKCTRTVKSSGNGIVVLNYLLTCEICDKTYHLHNLLVL